VIEPARYLFRCIKYPARIMQVSAGAIMAP
jgi:hypothetical protein